MIKVVSRIFGIGAIVAPIITTLSGRRLHERFSI